MHARVITERAPGSATAPKSASGPLAVQPNVQPAVAPAPTAPVQAAAAPAPARTEGSASVARPVPPPPRPSIQAPAPPPVRPASASYPGTLSIAPGAPAGSGAYPNPAPGSRPPSPGAPPPLPGGPRPSAIPTHAAGMPTLFVVFNGEKFPVNKEEFVIGRGAKTADLPIKDGNISRRHAAVVYQGGAFYMKDLGSTNGVEHQGRRVDSRRIEEGDVYQICDYELRFTYRA
jgi:hypothetical protein